MQGRAGGHGGQPLRGSQSSQHPGEPVAGDDFRPVRIGRHGIVERGARQETHGLAEGQPICRRVLDTLKARDELFQALAIHLHPLAAYPLQALLVGEQRGDFVGGERFAVQRDFHAEVEQGIHARQRRVFRADGGGDLGPGWAIGGPAPRQAHDDARRAQLRRVLQEADGLRNLPAQGVIDLTLGDHRGKPLAAFRRLLHRQEQGQKLRLLPAAGEFRQGLRERQMLGRARSRQAGGVSGEKGEGAVRILAVLRQVEMHAPHQIPGRMPRHEKVRQRLAGSGEFVRRSGFDLGPECAQHIRRQVLRAGHRRGVEAQGFESQRIGGGECDLPAFRRGGQRRHVAHREIPPEGPRRRQRNGHLLRAQMQQAVAGSFGEGECNPFGPHLGQGRSLRFDSPLQTTVGREMERCVHVAALPAKSAVEARRQMGKQHD